MPKNSPQSEIARPPVIAIMGHVDHGKSTLLDYIRKSNIVAGEAGGITQHIAAYEVTHTDTDGNNRRITFIDTPGHAAFSDMRNRGANIADIAILIVSAEDGVKTQTIEAINIIKETKVPFVVAINKIDKPNANPEKVKTELMEHGIFLEGYGGDTAFAEISAKEGLNVDELLDTLLLTADLEGFTGDASLPASGFVVESDLDQKRGISATLIIKNGTVSKGQFIVVGNSVASTRIMENFAGTHLDTATFSSPIILTGFSNLPEAGMRFQTFDKKKDAEKAASEYALMAQQTEEAPVHIKLKEGQVLIPLILKTDVAGTGEAITGEIEKLNNDDVRFKIIKTGVGDINESDVKLATSDKNTIILGFNVQEDKKIALMNEIDTITIHTFSIIYKMMEWLEEERENRREQKEVDDVTAVVKILKTFSSNKNTHVIGGRVESGTLKVGDRVKIIRNDIALDQGKITGLQQGKIEAKQIEHGNECGMMVEAKVEIASGDTLEAFTRSLK